MRGRGFRATTLAVVAALAAAGVAGGCGGDDEVGLAAEDRQKIEASLEALQAGFAADDIARMCRHMSVDAHELAGAAVHGLGSDCEPGVERLLNLIRKNGGLARSAQQPALVGVGADGAAATVTVKDADGARVGLPFKRERGRWKLDSFFGSAPQRITHAASRAAAAPFPRRHGGLVEVTHRNGQDCPALRPALDGPIKRVGGGCKLRIYTDAGIPVHVATPFGTFKFADCQMYMDIRVDSSGRTWATDLMFNSLRSDDGCGDVYQCTADPVADQRLEPQELPLKGRLGTDGEKIRHVTSVCLETCVGFYAGELTIDLRRDGRGWRARASEAGVGDSGFRLDGALRVRANGLDIRPASRG